MTLGAVTHVQHVDGAGLDDEQDPVSASAPTVDQLPDVLLELYALRGTTHRCGFLASERMASSTRLNHLMAARGARSLIQS